jgi:hypothetical protein
MQKRAPLIHRHDRPAPALPAEEATAVAVVTELQAHGLAVPAPLVAATLAELWGWARNLEDANEPAQTLGARNPLRVLRDALLREDAVSTGGESGARNVVEEAAADCAGVATWLERRCAAWSALAYAEAAAALEPESAARAHAVSRFARIAGLLAPAREWAAWSIRLAAVGRDHAAKAAALVEMGHIAATRQQYAEARRYFTVARRFAVSRRVAKAEGDALCGLALLRWYRDEREALDLFAQALEAYEPRSKEVLDLGHLLLSLWIERQEYRGAALLGRVLLNEPSSVGDGLALAALLARAAAALRWELTYESAYVRAMMWLGKLPPNTRCAAALLDLARAHGALRSWPRVELAADLARTYARRTGDVESGRLARRLVRASRRRKLSPRTRARLFPDLSDEAVPEGLAYPLGHSVRVLVTAFAHALRRRASV